MPRKGSSKGSAGSHPREQDRGVGTQGSPLYLMRCPLKVM